MASAATGADRAAPQAEFGGTFMRIPVTLNSNQTGTTGSTNTTVQTSPPAPVAPPVQSSPTSPATTANLAWCNANLHDAALHSLVESDVADGVLSRQDMLNVFAEVEIDGKVTSTEFSDLAQLVAKTSFYSTDNYVDVLATDVVDGNRANASFQGAALGNLAAGSGATQLVKLVDKWFLGQDHPGTVAGVTYVQATGSLFPHMPTYTDIAQGVLGDCYLLSSLAETALINPVAIENMFINNGDGTYTVKFNDNGKADYVTVDSKLPVDSRGYYVYANFGQNISNASVPLWVALAEKAYVQMDQSGWLRTDVGDTGGQNNYNAIASGYMTDALNQITGKQSTFSSVGVGSFLPAYNAGAMFVRFAGQADRRGRRRRP